MKERDSIIFTFRGKPPSKKNGRRFRKGKKGGYTVPSQEHDDWVKAMLKEHRPICRPLQPPYVISHRFWIDSFRRFDCDNAETTILDWLKVAGVIEDDAIVFAQHGEWDFAGLTTDITTVETTVTSVYPTPAELAMRILRHPESMRAHIAKLKSKGIKATQVSERARLWEALSDFDEYNIQAAFDAAKNL